jgi:hypothetical protein
LCSCKTCIRGDLPYKIFFVHSVREFYQSPVANVNRVSATPRFNYQLVIDPSGRK